MKRLLLISFTFIICFNSAVAQIFSKKDFKQLHWIVGSWKMPIKKGLLCEQWYVLNDSTLQSKGFIVKKTGDTILLESVQIAYRNNKLYYIPTVNGQNSNAPVTFNFTATTSKSFTAENPAHDFPQKIYYKLQRAAALYAKVSGIEKSVPKKEMFNYVKNN